MITGLIPLGVFSGVSPIKDRGNSWQLFLNQQKIVSSRDRDKWDGKYNIAELSRKQLKTKDTFHFNFQPSVISFSEENYLYLYLGKSEGSAVLVSSEKHNNSFKGRFAANRLLRLADSLSTNQLILQSEPVGFGRLTRIKIILKD